MPEDSETADIKKTLDIIMESVFNFPPDSYRQNQLEAMVAATLGNDIVICLPTGFGKSLCFQAPALYSGYGDDTRGDAPLTVVVSPLTSLMENQVQSLWDLNIKAIRLARTQAMDKGNRARFLLPEARILYLTPERLKTDLSLQKDLDERYECGRLRRFVIDEAHCVAENGTSNFRKDYLKLDQIRTRWERVPITLLSATFTAQTLQRTLKALRISTSPYLFKTTLDRPNLYWESKARNGSFSGIVYNFSQKSCVELADALRKYGISAFHYHADLEEPQKANIQSLWQSGVIKVVVATVAFGLGIDKQDVGFVIHAAVPKTLEGLYQEAGRAGRDGRKAKCIL
ncbi:P-loop containing nucleoside triphosphate hydrolase protein [Calocera viscosa TUFC12733]|uniref:DNA 3'-5' helicase n=1 Tax=Calocera viscosa (strain TUFC12733) TaxID=1330018 RepID=A0A167LQT0_CALVF|nr:P-loop containing nucleoside triphosphate hydrolase protein [Calocera viscosa TUFC12733]